MTQDEKYTNLVLLISDQCPYTIKMAVYPENEKTDFKDRRETSKSSLLEQLEDALSYLKINNKISSKIRGMKRIDEFEYPEEVIREAVLNCIRT